MRRPGSSREAALAGVDLHGAMVKVVRASCPQRVGLEGICLKHTAEMLYLLSPYNVLHGALLAAAAACTCELTRGAMRSGSEAQLRVCLCRRRVGVPRRRQHARGAASAAGGQAQRHARAPSKCAARSGTDMNALCTSKSRVCPHGVHLPALHRRSKLSHDRHLAQPHRGSAVARCGNGTSALLRRQARRVP